VTASSAVWRPKSKYRLEDMTAHFLIVALPLILERAPAAGAKQLI
jgi:hypothetical protein